MLLALRVARTIDDSPTSASASALKRIGTALAKYYICKRAPAIAGEALEWSAAMDTLRNRSCRGSTGKHP
jgi:hypothetical protein